MAWRESFLLRFGAGAFVGIPFDCWLRLLRDNRFAVDRPYWGRAALITVASIPNSIVAAWENWRYGRLAEKARIDPPLIILGIWRSGTTHLHNLLAQDDRFAYPTLYQVFYPHTFLSTESNYGKVVECLLPRTRPQDNIPLGVGQPQEDEFALCSLTGRGLAMEWAFPRRADHYGRYLTLRETSPDEIAEWKSALFGWVRKLSLKHGKPLVLKSPGHTCRIRLLLELFPEARFVHIHRNPYDVFRSTQHMIRTVMPWWALQRPDFREMEDRFFRYYREAYDVFFKERELIPQGRFHELRFETLEADPIGQLRTLYEALSLPDFGRVEPALRRYLAAIAGYKKNALRELPIDLRTRVAKEWRRCFEEWGYPM